MTTGTQVVRGIAVAALAVGVICQLVQSTDPTPALTYFTVWSAVLAVLVAGSRPARRTPTLLDDVATTGVAFSGLIYAAVIAPSRPGGRWVVAGDDAWVGVATILLHCVGPVLLLLAFLREPREAERPLLQSARACLWPALYLGTIAALSLTGTTQIPYEFLDPSSAGWPAAVGAGIVLGLAFAGLHRTLLALRSRVAAAKTTASKHLPS